MSADFFDSFEESYAAMRKNSCADSEIPKSSEKSTATRVRNIFSLTCDFSGILFLDGQINDYRRNRTLFRRSGIVRLPTEEPLRVAGIE